MVSLLLPPVVVRTLLALFTDTPELVDGRPCPVFGLAYGASDSAGLSGIGGDLSGMVKCPGSSDSGVVGRSDCGRSLVLLLFRENNFRPGGSEEIGRLSVVDPEVFGLPTESIEGRGPSFTLCLPFEPQELIV